MKRITAFYLLLFLAARAHAVDIFFDERGAEFTKSGAWVVMPRAEAYLGNTVGAWTNGPWGQFTFSSIAAGKYDVYLHFPVNRPDGQASPAVPVNIKHTGGVASVKVDMHARFGGKWNLLGRWDLNASSTLRLTSPGNGRVWADGVKLVSVSTQPPPAQCGDGIDNDRDGLTDYPSDPGCSHVGDLDETNVIKPPLRACEDGKDNDGDGLVDYPSDPGCSSVGDLDETNVIKPPQPFTVGPTTCAQARASSGVVFCQDFDGQALGDWNVNDLNKAFPSVGGVFGIKGPTGSRTGGPGRTSIVSGADAISGAGKALRVFFPKDKVIGTQFEWPITPKMEEAYFGYWVRQDPNSPSRKGGKIPGLVGGVNDNGGLPCCGNPMKRGKGFSTRMMWTSAQRLVNYFYWMENPRQPRGGKTYGDGEGPIYPYAFGKWYFIEQHIKLNNPGVANGILESWINGEKTLSIHNTRIRSAGSNFSVERILFHTYFGGPKSWAPSRETYNAFDVLVVSRSRIGKP